MRPRTRTATSSEEPSPIHFDHSHPWNANDRRGQGLVLELVGFQVTFLYIAISWPISSVIRPT